jgi:hypothetical protein
MGSVKLSFATTCKDRLFHLKETILHNIRDNDDFPEIEFVLLDYNSQDGMEEWARKELVGEIESGRVVYWKERTAKHYHSSHAKNIATGLCRGEVVCNLDADTFTGWR